MCIYYFYENIILALPISDLRPHCQEQNYGVKKMCCVLLSSTYIYIYIYMSAKKETIFLVFRKW